ncbi:RecQ family ATP-dependent DNA helicase [Gracilimonas mengyeensis]|uniref:ATP-dependent DNA helicase RecQ n=1 Tax=Gracilimonas mengyeensis TaxID=1302730 RepID=A0A521E068_9BACT|nr:RecQ family ATP-dependent DNA helicase [Gracilimonas mengyeensis]SMO77344.1 ATP-dependent DNA helicase RecQ [Gracilimonas mengyeensis]
MQELFKKAEANLQKIWGFKAFRPGQDEVVQAVFEGKNTLVLFPTGGGKSLCYQVPATVFEGMTLVISPLVALMQDQVQALKVKGISATFINSTIPSYEVEQRLVNARNGMYKLLYCAPERLKTSLWEAELPNLNIDLVAVDEAHCISQWGHDFRPSYREIRSSLESIADQTRWLALTATATPEVQKDITDSLGFETPNVISRGFSRPNLKWWVVSSPQKTKKLEESVTKAAKRGDGLVYGGTRKNCERLAKRFSSLGIKSEPYHAGIASDQRKAIQKRWIDGKTPLVVATNAFGMGIDKPDCRYVVHEEMPYSLEAYYQEAGRAGRDGKESYPILLYRESDYAKAERRLDENYPTRDELEHAYRILCDSFNLAIGSEMEESASFDINQIIKRGKLSYGKARSAMRLLDQFDIIAMQQEVEPAVGVQFMLSQSGLKAFREQCENDEKAEFVDKLERLYGTMAFRDMVQLDEKYVLEKLSVRRNALVKALNVLMQNDQILAFEMHKERTLVKVLEARSSKLHLSKKEVEAHRDNIFRKLELMHGYVRTETCREVYLRNYFGDTSAKPCGHCDNCLRTTKGDNSTPDNEELKAVYACLKQDEQTIEDLCSQTGLPKKTVLQSVQYLIREERITTNPQRPGYYTLLV